MSAFQAIERTVPPSERLEPRRRDRRAVRRRRGPTVDMRLILWAKSHGPADPSVKHHSRRLGGVGAASGPAHRGERELLMALPDVVPAPVIEVVPAESEALRAAMCPVAVHGQIAVNDFVIEAVRTVRNDLVATMCDAPADSASDPADMNARLVVIEHLLLRLEAALL